MQQVLFHGARERKGESVLKRELKAPKQAELGALQGRAGRRPGNEQRNENESRGDVHLMNKRSCV